MESGSADCEEELERGYGGCGVIWVNRVLFSLIAVAVAVDVTTRRDVAVVNVFWSNSLSPLFVFRLSRPLLWLRFALLLRQWHSRSSTRRVSPGRRTIEHATVPRVRCPVCYPTYALVLHTHTQQSRCLLFSFISRSSSHCRRRSQRRSRQRSRFACDHINRRLCKTFSYSFTICRSSTHIAGRASIHPTWLSISEPAQLNCPKRSAESDKRC